MAWKKVINLILVEWHLLDMGGNVPHIGMHVRVHTWLFLANIKLGKTRLKGNSSLNRRMEEKCCSVSLLEKNSTYEGKEEDSWFQGSLPWQWESFDAASVSQGIQLLQIVHLGRPGHMQMFPTSRNSCLSSARGPWDRRIKEMNISKTSSAKEGEKKIKRLLQVLCFPCQSRLKFILLFCSVKVMIAF